MNRILYVSLKMVSHFMLLDAEPEPFYPHPHPYPELEEVIWNLGPRPLQPWQAVGIGLLPAPPHSLAPVLPYAIWHIWRSVPRSCRRARRLAEANPASL